LKILGQGIAIRELSEDDLPKVYSLGMDLIEDRSFTPENLAELFMKGMVGSLVLVRKNKLLGFLIAGSDHNFRTVRWLFVNPSLGKKGLEGELLTSFIESNKNFKIIADLNENSIDLIKLFEDNGFIKKSSTVRLIK